MAATSPMRRMPPMITIATQKSAVTTTSRTTGSRPQETSPEATPRKTFDTHEEAVKAYQSLTREERQNRIVETSRKMSEALDDFKEAELHIKAGKPQLALAALANAIELIPGDSRFWLRKAEVHRQIGEYDAGLIVLREALERFSPDIHYAFYSGMAQIEITRKNPNAALEILEKPLQRKGGLPGLRLLRAESLAMGGNTDAALVAVEEAIQSGYLSGKKLRQNVNLASLREEPRFEALVRGLDERLERLHNEAKATLATEKTAQDEEKRKKDALLAEHARWAISRLGT